MTKQIHTTVLPNGDIEIDFTGFSGDECLVEEKRLRREMEGFGLQVHVAVAKPHLDAMVSKNASYLRLS